eukprot:TRINITY_DN4525_c0_g1_i8.p1 TRINITY_DN4525_c0_g1~~TRINITY_DN4525_c0_g1_i8.p1  ORF type:complete len:387 (-),score=21.70 TRINITY_DN4525_c0_g1_i8:937-2097(-)
MLVKGAGLFKVRVPTLFFRQNFSNLNSTACRSIQGKTVVLPVSTATILMMVNINISLFLVSCFYVYSKSKQVEKENTNCVPQFSYINPPLYSGIADIITNGTCQRGVYCQDEAYRRDDTYVFFINGTKPGQQFVFCTTHKAGSTRVKHMLRKLVKENYEGVIKFDRGGVHEAWQYHPLANKTSNMVKQILEDENIPRFIQVRNPYARFLSMFIFTMHNGLKDQEFYIHFKLQLGFQKDHNVTFEEFVTAIHNLKYRSERRYLPDRHFIPQTEHCRMDVGMRYNYILKMEEINDWFDCFMDRVNIREEMMHGWPGEDQCYLSTPKSPCNGPRQNSEGIMVDQSPHVEWHDTHSTTMVETYYKNKTLAKMVANIYAADFFAFDYPLEI